MEPRLDRERQGWRTGVLCRPPASEDVVDVMSEEKRQQQASDATNPEEKMFRQLWGIDLLLVHDCSILPKLN